MDIKKYINGGKTVIKNYFFAMLFFFVFFIGFYKHTTIYSIIMFFIMASLMYHELTHYAGVDKRKYGTIKPFDGAIYGLVAILPMALLQVIISLIDISIPYMDFATLKWNLIKCFVAPMLFIAKFSGYTLLGYTGAWLSMVLIAFLGYFAGYKNFDLNAYIRKLLKLQPKQKKPPKKKR